MLYKSFLTGIHIYSVLEPWKMEIFLEYFMEFDSRLETLYYIPCSSYYITSSLIVLSHNDRGVHALIVQRIGDMGVQFWQEISKFVTSFIYQWSIKSARKLN